jgi:DNA-binding beta-propeller fold protein YncE
VFAGDGTPGFVDGSISVAKFNLPDGIAIDPKSENIYVSDCNNNAIRKVTPQGIIAFLKFSISIIIFLSLCLI